MSLAQFLPVICLCAKAGVCRWVVCLWCMCMHVSDLVTQELMKDMSRDRNSIEQTDTNDPYCRAITSVWLLRGHHTAQCQGLHSHSVQTPKVPWKPNGPVLGDNEREWLKSGRQEEDILLLSCPKFIYSILITSNTNWKSALFLLSMQVELISPQF